jgi:hypothetical protein
MIEWDDAQRRCAATTLAKHLHQHPDLSKPERLDLTDRIIKILEESKSYLQNHEYAIMTGRTIGAPRLSRQDDGFWTLATTTSHAHP